MSEPTIELDGLVLPAGTIVGHAADVSADNHDPDPHPQVDAWDGVQVTFTPTVSLVVYESNDGPVVLRPRPEVGRFVGGRLVLDIPPTEGQDWQPLKLWASTGQDMLPETWGYTMTSPALPRGAKVPAFVLEPGTNADFGAIISGYLPEVPPPNYVDLLAALSEMRDLRTESTGAADRAEADADRAAADADRAETARDETEVISGLTGEDDAVALLVDTPSSATRTAIDTAIIESRRTVDVRDYGAKGDGTTNDTAAFQAALAASPSIHVPAGTYSVHNIIINDRANIRMDDGATLTHRVGAGSGAMFNFQATATSFKLRGGTINGNRLNQTGRPYIFVGAIPAGKAFDVEDVTFTGTVASIAYISDFGGYLNFSRNRVFDQAQHTGTGSAFTTIVTVVGGQEGAKGSIHTNENYCYWDGTPDRPGSNPGGFFVATNGYIAGAPGSEGFAQGNQSTWDAHGNYFYGYGQHDSVNDISPLHTYPTVRGARFTGNYFENCGFCAISAKSVQDIIIADNIILNGAWSAKNTASEGAISYVPGYQAAAFSRPRAVISGNIVNNSGGQTGVGPQHAISVHGTPTSAATDIIIANNVLTDCGYGINVAYVGDLIVADNIIKPGTHSIPYTQDGIRITHAFGDVAIRGNKIETPNGQGINATTGQVTATYQVVGNVVRHATAARSGIDLRGQKFIRLSGNTLEATAGNAMLITSDPSGGKVGHLVMDESNISTGPVIINYPGISKFDGTTPDVGVPTVTLGAGAGTGATATILPGSTNRAGVVQVTTGTSTAAGGIATVVFASPFPFKPRSVSLTPASGNAATLGAFVNAASVISASFPISAPAAPAPSVVYQWHYEVR